jgi:PAS domain S-box-containing protein
MKISDFLNGIPHPVALLDPQLRVVDMNCALEVLTGYATPEVIGVPVEYVVRSSFASEVFRTARNASGPVSQEGDIIDSVRKKNPVRMTLSPLRDEQEHLGNVLAFFEDISFLRSSEKKGGGGSEPMTGIIGHSPGMQDIMELLPVLAHTDATVLITGETGTGKDLLAETIHQTSKRAAHPFIKVNSGAIPESLLESELFGHVRGAFTGAHGDKPGMFRLAHGGTIYLTEIGDLPLQLQVKLLTVLDDREFYPLGSSRKVSVDVRIITGTHRNLKQLVRDGQFREDLFFRLNVLRAHLPPVRERGGDIRLLLDWFMQKIGAHAGKNGMSISRAAGRLLESYDYPGNVRELRNIVEFAVNMCGGNRIESKHLPPYIVTTEQEDDTVLDETSAEETVERQPSTAMAGSWTEIEKKRILDAMVRNNGNRTKAARELGLGRSTLWRKINNYGIG